MRGLANIVESNQGLATCLLVLGGDGVTSNERNNAARRLLSNIKTWVGRFLRRASPCTLDADDLEETIQHLMIRCATGSSRFRGSTEGEAHAWCMQVLQNKARDLCRSRWRLKRADSESDFDQPDSASLESLSVSELNRVIEAIVRELPRLHRRQDVEGLVRSLRCHIEARLGATMEEQMEVYGFAAEPGAGRSPETAAKARDRVYQYRKRGRAAGCEALSALVAQGHFAAADVTDVRRLLGCDVPTPAQWKSHDLS